MITITRQFAWQLRNLLRRIGLQSRSAARSASVLFLASEEGFHVRAVNRTIALEYHQPGPLPPTQFALPVEALAACEGKRDTPVTFRVTAERVVEACWEDRNLPVMRTYHDCQAEILDSWPLRPKRFATNDRRLVDALHAASGIVDREYGRRFAIEAIQLQGKAGKVLATDTRQALVVRGAFEFPWEDDLLMVPADTFGFPDFASDVPVEVGATDTHVVVRIRPWTMYFERITDRRFPDVEGACPVRDKVKTRVQIPAGDRDFLIKSLKTLLAGQAPGSPVTVDCNGQFAIRAQVPGETPLTELVLSRSQVSGEPVRLVTNRRHLVHGLNLGFSELQVTGVNAPCIFDDEQRTYFWMPLGDHGALCPAKDGIRIDSASCSEPANPQAATSNPVSVPNSSDERHFPVKRTATSNGSHQPDGKFDQNGATNGETMAQTNGQSHAPASTNGSAAQASQPDGANQEPTMIDPIAAAEFLQGDLRTALASTGRLLQALRRNRKQARLVETTLQSLRQLQGV